MFHFQFLFGLFSQTNSIYAMMSWFTRLFWGEDDNKAAEAKAKKKRSKEQSRRARARENELRKGKGGESKTAKFFWGSPGQTYQTNVDKQGRG